MMLLRRGESSSGSHGEFPYHSNQESGLVAPPDKRFFRLPSPLTTPQPSLFDQTSFLSIYFYNSKWVAQAEKVCGMRPFFTSSVTLFHF